MTKLIVYQKSIEFHSGCRKLAASKHLVDQLLRASSSIALNIAEGFGKPTIADRKRFYGIALGSLRECQAVFDLEGIKDSELRALSDEIGAILYTLSKRNEKPPSS